MVSRIKERLLQYKQELQKQTMYKEGLPEEDGAYIVTFKNGIRVRMAGYGCCRRTVLGYPIGHGWYNLETAQHYAGDSINAWMPLPKPYAEECEDYEVD